MSGHVPPLDFADAVRLLQEQGWTQRPHRSGTSHHVFGPPDGKRHIVVPRSSRGHEPLQRNVARFVRRAINGGTP